MGQCADRALPEVAVPQDPLADAPLSTLDKTDDTHLAATHDTLDA